MRQILGSTAANGRKRLKYLQTSQSSPSQVATTVEQLKKKLIFSLGISVWELFCKRLQTFWVEICLIIIFPPCRFFQHYYRKVKQTAKEKKQHSPPVVVIGSNLVNKRCFVVVCKTWAAAPTRLFRQDGVAANPLIFTLQTENPSTSGAPVCGHWFVYRYRAVEGSGWDLEMKRSLIYDGYMSAQNQTEQREILSFNFIYSPQLRLFNRIHGVILLSWSH